MEVAKEEKEADEQNNNNNNVHSVRVKECKGCLYYSSSLKSKTGTPFCVGISQSAKVTRAGHEDIVDKWADNWESLVLARNKGRNPSDFKYGCVGYSMHLHFKSNDSKTNTQEAKADWPACLGYEFLVDKKAPVPANLPESVSAPVLNKADGARVSQPLRTPKPASPTRDDFQTRFNRNARLVASGVTNNLIKVGNRVKGNLKDMLSPYRSKPESPKDPVV